MGNILKAGISYCQREGLKQFLVRIFTWIPEYIHWVRLQLAYVCHCFLCEHSDGYRGWYNYRVKNFEADTRIKFRRITTGLEYCKKSGQAYDILNPDEKVQVVLPEVFWERQEIERTVYQSPPIYITAFTEIEIYGATNILSKGNVVFSELYASDLGKERYNIEGNCVLVCHKRGKCIHVAYKKTDTIIDEAVYCMGGACDNYYHFTFEILSRLAFADKYEEYRSLPVLLDAVVLKIPSFKELFDRVNIYHHPIITVEKCNRVHVRKLIYASPDSWLPPNFKPEIAPVKEDFLISRFVVDNIRDRVLMEQKESVSNVWKKIYLSRGKCKIQRLINGEEIEKIFAEQGYHIVYMEELSFAEQVSVINHAEIIVGVAGAAFTNIVYCHEGARIGVFTSNCETPYSFSNIADMVKADYIVFRCDIVKKGKVESLNIFKADRDKCMEFIKYLEK